MCGRFTLAVPPELLAAHFELSSVPELAPRYNIAPTQPVAAIRLTRSGARRLELLHWGLIPHWARDPGIGAKLINARAETVAEKPSFRSAFRRRRCLIPASGFYEWRRLGKDRQPYLIAREDGAPLCFAGLWERWNPGKTAETQVDSCTIVTVAAPADLHAIHDRMPAVLSREAQASWLDRDEEDAGRLASLLAPTEGLIALPVSTRVNKPQNEDAACAEPIGERYRAEGGD